MGREEQAEEREVPLDVEFENEWETTSEWNEDDVEAVMEDLELWMPDDDTISGRNRFFV